MWSHYVWPLATLDEKVKLEEAAFFELFKREHDAMSSEFIDRTEALAEKFIRSLAGNAYSNEVLRLKKRHRPAGVLNESSLESYQGYSGFRFGLEDVFDFFQGLRACAETIRMARSSRVNILIFRKIHISQPGCNATSRQCNRTMPTAGLNGLEPSVSNWYFKW